MKKGFFIILISCFSLIIISCGDDKDGFEEFTNTDSTPPVIETDTTPPVITEVYPVRTPTDDPSPDYTFSSTKEGTITYGGSCSSGTTSATSGLNRITFLTLNAGTYSDCTIIVKDAAENVSNTLAVTTFILVVF